MNLRCISMHAVAESSYIMAAQAHLLWAHTLFGAPRLQECTVWPMLSNLVGVFFCAQLVANFQPTVFVGDTHLPRPLLLWGQYLLLSSCSWCVECQGSQLVLAGGPVECHIISGARWTWLSSAPKAPMAWPIWQPCRWSSIAMLFFSG